jgi:uncharacterized repeat protein (TIGR03803 family)
MEPATFIAQPSSAATFLAAAILTVAVLRFGWLERRREDGPNTSFTLSQVRATVRPQRLVSDPTGNLYGSTYEGGAYHCGTVFQLSPTSGGGWRESALYAFHCSDGSLVETLTIDAAGNLYGATAHGGRYSGVCDPLGCGVVFKLSPSAQGNLWTETVLHVFTGGSDGSLPTGGVVLDAIGNLYGTAELGGTGSGNVFEITP